MAADELVVAADGLEWCSRRPLFLAGGALGTAARCQLGTLVLALK